MWLANMFNLLNLLKQYSGDAEYQTEVSERQSAKFLRTFNLSQFWTILQRGIISLFVVIFSGGVKFITINPCSCSLTSFNLVPRLVHGGKAWHEVLKLANLFILFGFQCIPCMLTLQSLKFQSVCFLFFSSFRIRR